ncbi:hypothetical protein BGZ49_006530 [Haplosporangium sp. Z 27]|nr:hypothetical protein BGZ49_006530 [Haplosporangium sp. Z 27]
MNASCLDQHSASSSQATEPRISALTSSSNDPSTLVLLTDPSSPMATSGFNSSATTTAAGGASNITTATASSRPKPSFSGSGFFAAQDPSKHLTSQLPLETPFFTPQASWTEHSRSDYFASAASTPAHMAATASGVLGGAHVTSPNGSQANIFASGFSLPAQTPAAIEIPSFAASSPSYFPSDKPGSGDQEPKGFQLPPSSMASSGTSIHRQGSLPSLSTSTSTLSSVIDRHGGVSMANIPAALHRTNFPLSMMSSPHSPTTPRLPTSSTNNASVFPAELNLQVMDCDTVSRLLEQVLLSIGETSGGDGNDGNGGDIGGDKNAIMLLDMRPSISYSASTIHTAVNVCIPNMLLKRPNFSLQMVTEQLTTEQDSENLSRWREFSNIVLFDASGAAPVVGSPTFFMVQKFRKEGCKATLAYLAGT